jgi:dienelactone hydrolase
VKLFSKKKAWIPLVSVAAVLLVLIGGCAVYAGDYYRADEAALEAFSTPKETVCEVADGWVTVRPADGETGVGFIFYPGGKVEHTAYLPLLQTLATEGVFCVVVEMPLRLAVLDMNAADDVRAAYPDVETWYVGGHSLGGAMAASHVESRPHAYAGLILLGAYSTADLSETGLNVLSVYGSEDGVMNRETYAASKPNLPEDFTETVIEGGNHAYFGLYGEQEGDGTPTISAAEQIKQTAEAILSLMEVSHDD